MSNGFTDDDLKRFKTEYDEFSVEKVEALLARLACAECLVWAQDPHEGEIDKDFVRASRKAWRKSKGEGTNGQ